MLISVVIPAFNEADYLGATLAALARAQAFLLKKAHAAAEIIVVDNDSSDATAEVARRSGAAVLKESGRNVARVRNAGARLARGDALLFVDADTIVPEELLWRVSEALTRPDCVGGAADTDYRPARLAANIYLRFWRVVGKLAGMAQGAAQFCRRDVFFELHGYDETLFMGEDVDFYWRMKRLARRRGGSVRLLEDARVVPSSRRFDRWRFWRTLVWTNPLFILLFRRRRAAWRGWYEEAPR
ncbi:MAG TPA: glycosyltransferase [Pyrinomonadaceae bacterium]|nr:glycosyltransferase [Pyrinomonadaceae bacterium]